MGVFDTVYGWLGNTATGVQNTVRNISSSIPSPFNSSGVSASGQIVTALQKINSVTQPVMASVNRTTAGIMPVAFTPSLTSEAGAGRIVSGLQGINKTLSSIVPNALSSRIPNPITVQGASKITGSLSLLTGTKLPDISNSSSQIAAAFGNKPEIQNGNSFVSSEKTATRNIFNPVKKYGTESDISNIKTSVAGVFNKVGAVLSDIRTSSNNRYPTTQIPTAIKTKSAVSLNDILGAPAAINRGLLSIVPSNRDISAGMKPLALTRGAGVGANALEAASGLTGQIGTGISNIGDFYAKKGVESIDKSPTLNLIATKHPDLAALLSSGGKIAVGVPVAAVTGLSSALVAPTSIGIHAAQGKLTQDDVTTAESAALALILPGAFRVASKGLGGLGTKLISPRAGELAAKIPTVAAVGMGAIYAKNVYNRVTAGVETNKFTDVLTNSKIERNQIIDTYERTPVMRSPTALEMTRRLSNVFGTEIFPMAGGLALEPSIGKGITSAKATAGKVNAEYKSFTNMRVPDVSARARMEILNSIIPKPAKSVLITSEELQIKAAKQAIAKLKDPAYVKQTGASPAYVEKHIAIHQERIIAAGGAPEVIEPPKITALKEVIKPSVKRAEVPKKIIEPTAEEMKIVFETKQPLPKIDKWEAAVKKERTSLENSRKALEAEFKKGGVESGRGQQKLILKTIMEKPKTETITPPKVTKKPFLEEQQAKNKYRGETQYDVEAKKITKGITKEEYVALVADRARLAELSKTRDIAISKAKIESVLKPVEVQVAKTKEKSVLIQKSVAISKSKEIQKVRSILQPVQISKQAQVLKEKQKSILRARQVNKPVSTPITRTTEITRTKQPPTTRERDKTVLIPRPIQVPIPDTIQVITDIIRPEPPRPPVTEKIRYPVTTPTKPPIPPVIIPRILFPIFRLPSGGSGGATGTRGTRKKSWRIRNQIADLKSLFG